MKSLENHGRPEFYFGRLWQGMGWIMVFTVVWLSLTSTPPQFPDFLEWDKARHALAYACLAFWFRQAFLACWFWLIFLALLGVVLEILQGRSGIRTFDLFDIAANGVGIVIGYMVTYTSMGRTLSVLDHALANRVRRRVHE